MKTWFSEKKLGSDVVRLQGNPQIIMSDCYNIFKFHQLRFQVQMAINTVETSLCMPFLIGCHTKVVNENVETYFGWFSTINPSNCHMALAK